MRAGRRHNDGDQDMMKELLNFFWFAWEFMGPLEPEEEEEKEDAPSSQAKEEEDYDLVPTSQSEPEEEEELQEDVPTSQEFVPTAQADNMAMPGPLSNDSVEKLSDDVHSDGESTLSVPREGVPSWMISFFDSYTFFLTKDLHAA